MSWCEANRVDYVFGLARNPRLRRIIGAQLWEAHQQWGQTGKPARVFSEFSDREQAGMRSAGQATRRALEVGNRAYEERFGHIFLICASGRSGAEMLAELRRRLDSDPAEELRVAAGEQAKIIRLRLERLVEP